MSWLSWQWRSRRGEWTVRPSAITFSHGVMRAAAPHGRWRGLQSASVPKRSFCAHRCWHGLSVPTLKSFTSGKGVKLYADRLLPAVLEGEPSAEQLRPTVDGVG